MKTGEKQDDNRKPGTWKPGETGNPNGRPKKGYSITEMMREMLDSKPEVKDSIGAIIIAKALEGDNAALKMIWNYMDGMPQQKVEAEVNTQITVVSRIPDGSNT